VETGDFNSCSHPAESLRERRVLQHAVCQRDAVVAAVASEEEDEDIRRIERHHGELREDGGRRGILSYDRQRLPFSERRTECSDESPCDDVNVRLGKPQAPGRLSMVVEPASVERIRS